MEWQRAHWESAMEMVPCGYSCEFWGVLEECRVFLWEKRNSVSGIVAERGTQGPKKGPTWKWIVWGDTCAGKARDFIGKGHPRVESSRVREPGELLCHMAHSLGFYGGGIGFLVVSGQSFWLRVLPGGAHIAQPRRIPVRRILGGGRTCGISFDLSQILPVCGGLLLLCSLSGSLVIK